MIAHFFTTPLFLKALRSISHPKFCCPFFPCSCHYLQIPLSIHSLCCVFLWRLLASLHWAVYAMVKSRRELITFIILCVLIQGRALRLRQTDAGQREAWINSRAVSSGGRQGRLDCIPNHPPIHSFFGVMAIKKSTYGDTNFHTAEETDVALNWHSIKCQSREAGLLAL